MEENCWDEDKLFLHDYFELILCNLEVCKDILPLLEKDLLEILSEESTQ